MFRERQSFRLSNGRVVGGRRLYRWSLGSAWRQRPTPASSLQRVDIALRYSNLHAGDATTRHIFAIHCEIPRETHCTSGFRTPYSSM